MKKQIEILEKNLWGDKNEWSVWDFIGGIKWSDWRCEKFRKKLERHEIEMDIPEKILLRKNASDYRVQNFQENLLNLWRVQGAKKNSAKNLHEKYLSECAALVKNIFGKTCEKIFSVIDFKHWMRNYSTKKWTRLVQNKNPDCRSGFFEF